MYKESIASLSVCDEKEERRKGNGKRKKSTTSQSKTNLGKLWEVALVQMDGDNLEKAEAAESGRQSGNEERSKATEVYFAQWVDVENREKVHEKIQGKLRDFFFWR